MLSDRTECEAAASRLARSSACVCRFISSMARRKYRTAALVGDLATDNDAGRLARSGAPVKQINTGTVCHLEAEMVAGNVRRLDPRLLLLRC